MSVARALALFIVAAVAEIGGAWLIWQGAREHRGVAWIGAGIVALAAYGGIFVAGSLAWGIVMDGFKPDRYDYLGATICLVGVAVIMFAPRA